MPQFLSAIPGGKLKHLRHPSARISPLAGELRAWAGPISPRVFWRGGAFANAQELPLGGRQDDRNHPHGLNIAEGIADSVVFHEGKIVAGAAWDFVAQSGEIESKSRSVERQTVRYKAGLEGNCLTTA
jgi:hypothetical protein